jgi:hypothetical protein
MSNNYLKYHFRFIMLFVQGVCFYEITEDNEKLVTDYIQFLDIPFFSISLYSKDLFYH